ncbi:MAG TPA: hypothetical protein VJB94_01120 [Candidatus Nanoarchaeia archaeon]|nr:hypothetical protein [Candidatus Nanoarchaeia archaeon]
MKNEFQFEELSDDEKKILLSAFSYEVDREGNIIDVLLKEKVKSKITGKPLTIKDAALLPGSLKVIDSDPLTISRFIREEIEKDESRRNT